MAYPVAVGVPSLSGTYIPSIWSPKLIAKFYALTALSEIMNVSYEGDIKAFGDTVKINGLPDITISDYVQGQEVVPENPNPAEYDLLINKGKKWAFNANTVQVKQSKIAFVDEWTNVAGQEMKRSIEYDVYANIYADPVAANQGNTAGAVTASVALGAAGAPLAVNIANALTAVIGAGQVLDEQNVPEEDRWILLPPWWTARMKTSDLGKVYITGDKETMARNGKMGMIDRFTVYTSNLMSTATDSGHVCTRVLFGHKIATAFATQIVFNEQVDNQKDFGKIVRGLQVFGYKTIKPSALGSFLAYAA